MFECIKRWLCSIGAIDHKWSVAGRVTINGVTGTTYYCERCGYAKYSKTEW